jgi:JAB domain-containing protein similar to deubiquitination enzymes
MKGYSNIELIIISNELLARAYNFLRYAGSKGVEGICLFAGNMDDNKFIVKETIIPRQTGYIMEQGLMYAVDSDELRRLSIWLYENNMQLIAQIHSHPTVAYHSEADDRFPIVVPNFASGDIDLEEAAIYRLSSNKSWNKLSNKNVNSLFRIK